MAPLDKIDKLGIIMGIELVILLIWSLLVVAPLTAAFFILLVGLEKDIGYFVASVLTAIVIVGMSLIIDRHAEKKEKEIFKNEGN